jgi:soluble lytic murein transglycosylase-like protein
MTKDEIIKEIKKYSDLYKFPFDIALIIAQKESNLNPNARGNLGEYGLYQILPTTWQDITNRIPVSDPFNPSHNIHAGIYYLAVEIPVQLAMYNVYPSLKNIILSYNGGSLNVARGTVTKAAKAYYWDVVRRWFVDTKLAAVAALDLIV